MPDVGSMWHHQTVKDRWEAASTATTKTKRSSWWWGYRRANYLPRKIAEELTLRGLTPKRGGTWHPNQVRLLLLAQIRAGELTAVAQRITRAPDRRTARSALRESVGRISGICVVHAGRKVAKGVEAHAGGPRFCRRG